MDDKKCLFCGKISKTDNIYCSRKCSTGALNRAMFIRRTSKEAQMYYKYYQFEMERITFLNWEN